MTTITITVPDTIVVSKRDGAECKADITAWPENSLAAAFVNGVSQLIRDASSAAKNAKESAELMAKKHDALVAGEVRVHSARTTDEIGKFARTLAEAALRKSVEAEGQKWASFKPADRKTKLDEMLSDPKWRVKAEAALSDLD